MLASWPAASRPSRWPCSSPAATIRELDDPVAGVPALRLAGLGAGRGGAAADRVAAEPIDPAVAAQIAPPTGGNPLALIDLASELSVKQLTGVEPGRRADPDRPSPGGALRAPGRAASARDVQLWLLLAAADSTGNVDLISAAAADLGSAGPDAGDEAEAAGLVELGQHGAVPASAGAVGRLQRRPGRGAATGAPGAFAWPPTSSAWSSSRPGTPPRRLSAPTRRSPTGSSRSPTGPGGGAASPRGPGCWPRPPSSLAAGPRKYARLIAAAEAALAAGAAQLAKSLLDELDEDVARPCVTRPADRVVRSVALFTADPALSCRSATCWRRPGFHGEDPRLEQTALIRAFEYTLPAERLTGA